MTAVNSNEDGFSSGVFLRRSIFGQATITFLILGRCREKKEQSSNLSQTLIKASLSLRKKGKMTLRHCHRLCHPRQGGRFAWKKRRDVPIDRSRADERMKTSLSRSAVRSLARLSARATRVERYKDETAGGGR